jgi:hypothetical protein
MSSPGWLSFGEIANDFRQLEQRQSWYCLGIGLSGGRVKHQQPVGASISQAKSFPQRVHFITDP